MACEEKASAAAGTSMCASCWCMGLIESKRMAVVKQGGQDNLEVDSIGRDSNLVCPHTGGIPLYIRLVRALRKGLGSPF